MAANNKSPDGQLVEGALLSDCVAVLVYTTFPSHDSALAAATALVEGRLAGCVNIIPAMTSIYVWDGKTEISAEVVLIAKAPSGSIGALARALKAAHPYAVPAILVLPVAAASADYLAWLRAGVALQVPDKPAVR